MPFSFTIIKFKCDIYFHSSTHQNRRLNTVQTLQLRVMWGGLCLQWYREQQEQARLVQSECILILTCFISLSPCFTHFICPSPFSSSEPSTSPSAHSIPQFQHPSHMLLKANGFQQQQYSKYHQNCLRGLCRSHPSSRYGDSLHSRLSFRAQAFWNRPVSGDEHPVPFLVFLFAYSLQSVSPYRVQCFAHTWYLLCQRFWGGMSGMAWLSSYQLCVYVLRQMVLWGMSISSLAHSKMYNEFRELALEDAKVGYRYENISSKCNVVIIVAMTAGMDWSVSSGSTVMDWRRSFAWKYSMTSRKKLSEITMMEACMGWRNSGPSSSITR